KENRKSDYILNLNGGLGARMNSPRTTTELIGNINQQLFYNNSGFNNTSEDAKFSFLGNPSERDRFIANDDFFHAYEPRSFEQELGRSQGRYGTFENKANLLYGRDLNSSVSLSAS